MGVMVKIRTDLSTRLPTSDLLGHTNYALALSGHFYLDVPGGPSNADTLLSIVFMSNRKYEYGGRSMPYDH